MGIFSRKSRTPAPIGGPGISNWATDPITSQSKFADPAPQIFQLTQEMIEQAGCGSLHVAPQRMLVMVTTQTVQFASAFPGHGGMVDIENIFDTILVRDDFDPKMLFDALTYFGPIGVATRNSLIEQVPHFLEALERAARDGYLENE